MALDYLDFEYSEDDHDNGTWDAMASVSSQRWPALLQEVQQVLQWASQRFQGRRGPLDDGGDWDFDLSAQDDDSGDSLHLRWNATTHTLEAATPPAGSYTTLTLTLTGTPAFGDALRLAFDVE